MPLNSDGGGSWTSILVDTQTQPHYNAETALMAVVRLLILTGLPRNCALTMTPAMWGTG